MSAMLSGRRAPGPAPDMAEKSSGKFAVPIFLGTFAGAGLLFLCLCCFPGDYVGGCPFSGWFTKDAFEGSLPHFGGAKF